MTDIFISYAPENSDDAQKLCLALRGEGYRVWWDYDLYAGEDRQDGVDAVLTNALAVIVIWSPAASRSARMHNEVEQAIIQDKLIATYLPPFKQAIIPEDFRRFHVVDATEIKEIIRALDWRGLTPRNKRPLPTSSQYLSLGLEFRRQGALQHAYSQFSKSIVLNPKVCGYAYYYRSEIYNQRDAASIQRAIEDIECSIAIGGRDAENYRQLGVYLHEAKQFDAAIQALSISIRNCSKSQRSFLYRGRAYSSMNMREPALADYLKSVELDPDCFEAHWELADLYESLGEGKAAAQHCIDIEAFRPKTADGVVHFAKYLWEEADHRIALDLLADAAARLPRDWRLPLMSALIRIDLEEYQQAMCDAEMVVALNPFYACAYRVRAQLSMNTMLYDDAVRDLTRAIELSFENSIDYDKRATAHSFARDERASSNDAARADAIRAEERRLGLCPDPPVL